MFRSHTEVYRTLVKPQTPTIDEWFTCDLCTEHNELSSLWRTETDLEMHRKHVHSQHLIELMKAYSNRFCSVCMTLQDSTESLIVHLKTRHLFSSAHARRVEREIFICDTCGHIFFNKAVLEAHMLYVHMWRGSMRGKRTFTCPKCHKLVQLKVMWFHLQQHEIPGVSVCDICLTSCRTTHDLILHMKTHPMHYKCETCHYHSTKEEPYRKHLDAHREMKYENTKLKKWKKMFRKHLPNWIQTKYNTHHTIKGLILPNFLDICVLCREICTSKAEISKHIRRDHMVPLRLYTPVHFRCACGEQFASRVLLKHHAFKLRGAHRQIADDNTTTQDTLSSDRLNTNVEKEESGQNENEQDDNEQDESEQDETSEQNETTKQIAIEWQVEPKEDIVISDNMRGLTNISETVTLRPLDVVDNEAQEMVEMENNGDELVYIYTTVADEEMVNIEEDSGQVLGF